MPTFTVTLEKKQTKRTDPATIHRQLKEIVERGVAGARKIWSCSEIKGYDKPISIDNGVIYKAAILLRRRKVAEGIALDAEMRAIMDFMQQRGNSLRWQVTGSLPSWRAEKPQDGSEAADAEDFVDFKKALTYDEVTIPEILCKGSDAEIEAHPAFNKLYGRSAHVRIMASSMQTGVATKGMRRNHLVYYGLPGCGKSSLFHSWQTVLPPGSFVKVNANSATKAGLEDLFLSRLKETGVPPFLFVEEIEKTLEAILTTWLSILDERAEVRKITHGRLRHAEVRSLLFATANDKLLLDKIMGGRPGNPGAISSRMTGVYVPRPDESILRRILHRDIELFYPEAKRDSSLWVEACINLANEVKTNDPRKIVTFLDGRERLLTGEYQADIISLHELEAADRREQSSFEEEIVEYGRLD